MVRQSDVGSHLISKKITPFARLTVREAELCERILTGYTSTGISLDLGMATSSVNTYWRAYDKLRIAMQNELFSLCLAALGRLKAQVGKILIPMISGSIL